MALNPPSPALSNSYILAAATGALAIGIFVADTLTDAEIAVAVLYVAVVLMSDRFCQKRGVLIVGFGCMVLTVVSLFLSPGDPWGASALCNGLLSFASIGATTFLVLKNRQAGEELHQAQAELARVTRVTTLGELTAAIAHEVNQPLTGLVSSGHACLRWLAGESPNLESARRAVERMINDGHRASEVVSRIRALVRKSPPRRDWLNINDTIMEDIALIRSEVQRNGISLRTEVSNDLPLVQGDRIQLQQVILNLFMNAIEAMSGVSEVQRELLVASVKDGSKGVLIEVRDSGPGLDRTALDRLFDAFYTTKPDGMGMGLAISRTIIEAHGGQLWATPNVPKGAIFQFGLPPDGQEVCERV